MRKILFVLAALAVLGLGGCSVSDDGGENYNGDKNMAVTVYPDVVVASRTVVDGGTLVDYVSVGNISSFDFTKILCEKLKVDFSDLGSYFDKELYLFDVTFSGVYGILNAGLGNDDVHFYGVECGTQTVKNSSGTYSTWTYYCSVDSSFSPVKYYKENRDKYKTMVEVSLSDFVMNTSKHFKFTVFEPTE